MTQNRNLIHPCNEEIQGKLIGQYNNLKVAYIPLGVRVFIGTDSILDINKDYEIDDKLQYKESDRFATPENLYLHTIGTSAEKLNISCTVINNGVPYFENIKKETLDLNPTIEKSLKHNVFRPNGLGDIISIDNGLTHVLDTTFLNSIRFMSDGDITVNLNDSIVDYPMLEDELFLDNIQSLKITNVSGSTINFKYWEG